MLSVNLVSIALLSATAGGWIDDPKDDRFPIVGRWDITVHGTAGTYPSWLEVSRSGYSTLVGSFVGRVGSARPISRVQFENGRLEFSLPLQWEEGKVDLHF